MVGGWLRREPKKARKPEPPSAPVDAEPDATSWNGWDPSSQSVHWEDQSGPVLSPDGAPGGPQVYSSRRHETGPLDEQDEPTTVFRLDQANENTTVLNLNAMGHNAARHEEPTTRLVIPAAAQQDEPTAMLQMPASSRPEEPTTVLRLPAAGQQDEPTTVLRAPMTGHLDEPTTVFSAPASGSHDELTTVLHKPEDGRHEEPTVLHEREAEPTVLHRREADPAEEQTVLHKREDGPAEEPTVLHERQDGPAGAQAPGADPEPDQDPTVRYEQTEEQTLLFRRAAVPPEVAAAIKAEPEVSDHADVEAHIEVTPYASPAAEVRPEDAEDPEDTAADEQPVAVGPRVPQLFRSPPPDTTIDGAEAGGVVYRAASVRGLDRRELDEPRQGSYTVQLTEDQDWLVGCLSDGVSGAARSHEATAVICDRISRALVDHLAASPPSDDPGRWETEIGAIPWTLVLRSVNDAVCELAWPYLSLAAQQNGTSLDPAGLVPPEQAREIMAGTALAFVVATKASPDGVHRAMLARVAGDSAVFTLRGEKWIPLARVEDDDEGEAAFWSPVEALPGTGEVETRSFSLRPGEPLIVMTNELGDPLETAEEPVSGFLTARWRTPPDLLEFAQHLAFYRKTFTGDRTAIAVWPTAG